MSESRQHGITAQQVRIIGGKWRGRKLTFQPAKGLRPTGDRIRETLFNWLAAEIHGARCADLFAGTGALGVEALSRGAALCDFVDNAPATLTTIAQQLQKLDASGGLCHAGPAARFLKSAAPAYDIVFVDPPFKLELLEQTCTMLAQRKLLRSGGLIYTESAAQDKPPEMPADWSLHRDKVAGEVAYRLYRTNSGPD